MCQGYADLFTIMATHVGLDAWTVTGTAKDYFSSKGRKYNGTSGHAWNIVSLADREILVDSTWGAGYVNGNTFHRSFDDEWFDTHPAVFIFSHLPANTEYELLDTIIY